jgi:cellulose synthase/poly-beta-1,6-N-acetylglucosamine synthase-like glycosyltransferase
MLISVVVPAFNEEQYIRRCLEALARQYHPHFEFETIVVDGNSTDPTREIAHEYGVHVIRQQHRGIAPARQLGFEAARGEIIASTDADSAPPRDWLVRLVAELQRTPQVVGIYGPLRLYDGKGYEDFLTHYLAGSYLWANSVIKRPAFSGQNFAVRREAWARVGGFDTGWVSAEDVNLSLKLRRIGQVKFCWNIQVATSGRRAREGYGPVLKHTLSNYLRVTWLNAPPLPFSDIR